MAIQVMLVGAPVVYTDNEIVDKINAAEHKINRAGCVEDSALSKKFIATNPGVDEFPIVSMERTSDGKLSVKYDDGT